ncbi:MAG: hypothetical protein IT198_15150 [Acidimicrobiia bacterium]|nr:hypothetical protein [Acidimicrobiia bacterium]
MKLKSKGLGRKELVMDFREYVVLRQDDELVIRGTIHEPVHWDFTITMCEDDLPGLVHVATRRETIRLLLRALFKTRKQSHWSDDRKEHVGKAKERRKENRERAAEAAEKETETVRKRPRLATRTGAEAETTPDAQPAGAAQGTGDGDGSKA